VITVNWMANSIVFIVMVTHQCAFTPHIHVQGKALYKLYNVAYLSAVALIANLQVAYFPNFFYMCRLTVGFEGRMFFLYAKNVVP